jgi:hypothetical protein
MFKKSIHLTIALFLILSSIQNKVTAMGGSDYITIDMIQIPLNSKLKKEFKDPLKNDFLLISA